MTARPPLSSRTTAYSDSSGAPSLFSASARSCGNDTAMTSPNLESPRSPKKAWLHGAGKMEQMLTVLEADEPASRPSTMMATENMSAGGSRRASAVLGRGKSVKDRASAWEGSTLTPTTACTPTRNRIVSAKRPLPSPTQDFGATRGGSESGTAPLRINKRPSPAPTAVGPSTPTPVRRVPVPATAPVLRQKGTLYDEPDAMTSLSAKRGSPPLKRGKGSARKMIQQWENLPTDGSPRRRTPSGNALQPSKRIYSREYLDAKPLPVPSATPLPTSNYYSPKTYTPAPKALTPSRSHRPSPLHLQTPTSAYRPTSPTSPHSLSTSPSSGKLKGKSPLKDMLNVFGGGIRDVGRKMKARGKDRFGRSRESLGGSKDDLHFWEEPRNDRVGTSGLPGGIVFNDRMGDQEMVGSGEVSYPTSEADQMQAIRSSAAVYLVPTPCSSVAPWGSWLTSYATLTHTHLRITYCPVFQGPSSGNSTPRRLLSGNNLSHMAYPSVPYGAIPLPAADQEPDVELNMKDCVEVRSLRREEIKGRGIPPAPEGIGTEVLEMVWSDGGKRYLGVEGVGGRLGWVSAIWSVSSLTRLMIRDVLLACQSAQPPHLPPPSPVTSSIKANTLPQRVPQTVSPLGSFAYPANDPPPELTAFRNRIASLESKVYDSEPPASTAPPVQKVGDTWVAASLLAPTEVEMPRSRSAENLRDSVQRMFDNSPELLKSKETLPLPTRRESESDPMERVMAWQQPDQTTQHLSIFRLARGTIPPTEIALKGDTDTMLSFDPNDLNPSRSASQVRRQTTVGGHKRGMSRSERRIGLAGIEEVSVSDGASYKPPTHISHITFPKPTMNGQRVGPSPLSPHMERSHEGESTLDEALPQDLALRSPSVTSRSGAQSVDLRTPQTVQDSVTTLTSAMDQIVLAKLDDHSSEHGKIERQMDGVQGELQKVIGTLSTLVAVDRKGIDGKLDSVAMDVKAIENALNLNLLAAKGPPSMGEPLDGKVPDVHRKLDAIAKLCEELLSRPMASAAAAVLPNATPAHLTSAPMAKKGSLGIAVDAAEEKQAGEEVAAIMADLVSAPRVHGSPQTGGSSKGTLKPGGIQVLHSVTGPSTPSGSPKSDKLDLPEDARKQVGEVLSLVKEMKDARALQTQQTTDIARCKL